MIPTLRLGQTGQASNQGRVAWRAAGTTNMTLAHSTVYALNLTVNERDEGNLRPNPDQDSTIILPRAGWYAACGAYRTSGWPSSNGYNGTTMGFSTTAQPFAWHENHMTTGYAAGKMVFGVGYARDNTVLSIRLNQYSSNNVTVTGSSINMGVIALHNNMMPFGVDLIGSGTSLGNTSAVPLTYTSAHKDDGNFWSGPDYTALVVPTGGAGWYAMSGWYRLIDPPQLAGGARGYWMLNNQTLLLGGSSTPCNDGSKSPPATAIYYLNEGDSVEYIANQNVGSTRTTDRQRVGLTRINTTDGVCVSRSNAQSIPLSSTVAASFDTEEGDDLGAWTISEPTKLTVPAGKSGWYIIAGTVWWAAYTGYDRDAILIVDGTTEISRMEQYAPSYHNDPRLCVATIYYLTEGQYVELHLRNSVPDSAVSTQGRLSLAMVRVDIG